MRVGWVVLPSVILTLTLAGCTASLSSEVPPGAKDTSSAPELIDAGAVLAPPSSAVPSEAPRSTVPEPPRAPALGTDGFFADAQGRGAAVGTIVERPWSPDTERWQRDVKIRLHQIEADGVVVRDAILDARLDDGAVVVTTEHLTPGGDGVQTVSRRVSDILRDEPMWTGPTGGSRVVITFTTDGMSPLRITTMRVETPVFRTQWLPAAGPVYSVDSTADAVIHAAALRFGARRAAIIGYLVDVSRGSSEGTSTIEALVAKDGSAYTLAPAEALSRPRNAFGHTPTPRQQPQAAIEASMEESALANAAERVGELLDPSDAVTAQRFAYVVRLDMGKGDPVDVIIEPDGSTTSELGEGLRVLPLRALPPSIDDERGVSISF